jgi:hypothetical protein
MFTNINSNEFHGETINEVYFCVCGPHEIPSGNIKRLDDSGSRVLMISVELRSRSKAVIFGKENTDKKTANFLMCFVKICRKKRWDPRGFSNNQITTFCTILHIFVLPQRSPTLSTTNRSLLFFLYFRLGHLALSDRCIYLILFAFYFPISFVVCQFGISSQYSCSIG